MVFFVKPNQLCMLDSKQNWSKLEGDKTSFFDKNENEHKLIIYINVSNLNTTKT